MGEGTIEKHASVEYLRAGKLWAKPEALKIVWRTNVKVVCPHYGMERSHITKAEIRQRRSERAERREQERGLFLAVRIGRQKLLEATPLHAAQLAAVGSSSSRL